MTRDEVVAALDRLVDLALAQFSQGGVVNVEREVQALADLVPTSTDPMHFIMASDVTDHPLGFRLDVECDPSLPSADSPAPHQYEVVGEESDSLANGGSYEILLCRKCKRRAYTQLPD